MTNPKPRIAFLGLGTMGAAIATNLCQAGFQVNVWNRTIERTKPFKPLGARLSDSVQQAILDVDIICYSLSDDKAIDDVVFGNHGILATATAGQLAIDLSTGHPETSLKQAKAYRQIGVEFLDCPVFGSLPEAKAADLCLIVGGSEKNVARAGPVFSVISSSVHHMGSTGKGAAMSLIGSMMVCFQLQALSEGLTLAHKANLNIEQVVEILGLPDFRSPIFRSAGADIIRRQFDPVFSLDHLYKDARGIMKLAEENKVSVPGTAAIFESIKSAVSQGWGQENSSALIKAVELQSNTIVMPTPTKNET